MDSDLILTAKKSSRRHYLLVMAFTILGLCLILFFVPLAKYFFFDPAPVGNLDQLVVVSPSRYARSAPLRLQIPTINVDTDFVLPLGLNQDNTLVVPDSYTKVGWYGGGSSPGENGPAVILGHVDSKEGPAVFYALGQLNVGDDIVITRADGTVVNFVVTKLQRYPQANFPTTDVYGKTDKPMLRLVTCTGLFDKAEKRYSHNLVVFAELKDEV